MNLAQRDEHARWKNKKSLYVCFIDYSKAFDRIKHHRLIQIFSDKAYHKKRWRSLEIRTGVKNLE